MVLIVIYHLQNPLEFIHIRFENFAVVNVWNAGFWVMMPCSLGDGTNVSLTPSGCHLVEAVPYSETLLTTYKSAQHHYPQQSTNHNIKKKDNGNLRNWLKKLSWYHMQVKSHFHLPFPKACIFTSVI
jgi:hypothetical protein